MSKVTLFRKDGEPPWEFQWDDEYNGYVYKTKQNIYRIFFDNCTEKSKHDSEPDIWIGRLDKNDNYWFTCEKAIKAKSLIMFRGQYNFR